MARSIETIQTDILTSISENANLQGLNSTSRVAIYRLIAYIVAVAIHVHEVLFDTHKKEVEDIILNQKNARLPWYRTMALNFQYGFDLVPDKDYYDNTNATEEQIELSKIIKYAAVNESDDESRVILKIAGEEAGELAPISTDPINNQKEAFDEYIKEIKPAGVKVTTVNYLPDLLYLDLTIYRDALVLDENGMSILNGNYPVEEAISEFMKELPFNGEFTKQSFVDKLQKVTGVKIAHINNIESAWIDPDLNDYGNPVSIDVKRIPESGYFKVVNFDNINYVV